MTWQPIKTAPAGDWVIIFDTNREMNISRYDNDKNGVAHWQCGLTGEWFEPRAFRITHWMPLPKPPK